MAITIKGSNRVRNNLRRTISDVPEIADDVLAEHTNYLRRELKGTKYPPKRPGQTYTRTGTLANSWARKRIKAGVWAVVNNTTYAIHVVNAGTQAWMHEGRWWTMQEIERDNRPRLTKNLTNAIENLIDGD